jgi:hypothetical protein
MSCVKAVNKSNIQYRNPIESHTPSCDTIIKHTNKHGKVSKSKAIPVTGREGPYNIQGTVSVRLQYLEGEKTDSKQLNIQQQLYSNYSTVIIFSVRPLGTIS